MVLVEKRLVFAIYNVIKFPANVDGFGKDWSLVAPIKDGIFWTYRAVFTRDGFLGVDGPNFDFVLLCREIVETALQTQQAYRMSLLVPRRELNRGYVALLVLNCWSTALVHSFFRNHATQRRLLALICDCVLDLVSSVGITTVLVAMYIPDFEFKTYGFPLLLLLVRVNMTNGEIPIGLHADDFPQSLEDIEFCVTNLRSLPEDLDLKWPQYASIYIEASQFLDVPQSLVRLAPFDLSLSLNPISTIPKELFESESVAYLNFGGTLISELPENVSKLSSSMTDINLSGTNVSFFWLSNHTSDKRRRHTLLRGYQTYF
ncbi:hypothetical protein GN958_ATG18279 [Phytophthora infestans]|uniref:Uncharacterized protein n=1 Tax=Phytophthora infestans TaxID=4787 RepID=A0A8S9U087_PHYIN|nr:hypothetical protein GN958_ATG18279 [Phytophthora infestans]